MTLIRFIVRGTPAPQPRTRSLAFIRGATVKSRVYDPGSANDWKALVAIAARPHVPLMPLSGPIELTLRFRFARPKRHYGAGRFSAELKASAPRNWHYGTRRCDFDNLAKAVADVLTQIGLWTDDAEVSRAVIEKHWADHAGFVGCEVTVTRLEE